MKLLSDVAEKPGPSTAPALDITTLSEREVVPARYPWRVAAGALVLLLLGLFIKDTATNPAWDWPTFTTYLFEKSIMEALGLTLQLTAISAVIGFAGGIILAMMRMSGNPVLSTFSWAFVWLFRSIPLIVQLLLWGNISYLYSTLTLKVPFGPTLYETETVHLISSFTAAIIGLSLHQAAYAAEIVRSGLLSVDQGQIEACTALGIPPGRQFRRIVLPQAMRTIIPTAASDIITLLKTTSIVFVLAIGELFYQVQVIYGMTGRVVPMLIVATFWYVVLVTVLSIGQFYVERHFARGAVRNLPPTPLQVLRAKIRQTFGKASR